MVASFFRTSAAFLVLGALVGACHKNRPPPPDPAVIATVNGEPLPFKEFDRELARDLRAPEGDGPPPDAETVDKVRRQLLERMVAERLMLQAARQLNLTVKAEEIDRRLLRIKSDYSGEGYIQALEESQLTQTEYEQKTLMRLTLEKLLSEHVYPRVALTEEEIRQEYDKDPKTYAEPEQVRAAQIVVKTLEDAQKVLAQLRAGKRFEEMARKYSLSADAKVGGDLGFFPRGVMPPEFDEVAFQLGVNQLSDVVTTEYGFHIFKVLERRPARKRSFAEVREKVEAVLLARKRRDAEADFRKSLRDNASVHVNETALASAQGETTLTGEEPKHP
jgi:peptidyl-prolyl cis-trans isomerase C/foldase protein PrsA